MAVNTLCYALIAFVTLALLAVPRVLPAIG